MHDLLRNEIVVKEVFDMAKIRGGSLVRVIYHNKESAKHVDYEHHGVVFLATDSAIRLKNFCLTTETQGEITITLDALISGLYTVEVIKY